MLDKREYHFECLRRRRAGWFVKADGMGRMSELLRAAGCFYDRRENEWLCPTEAVYTSVKELRLMLDTLAVPVNVPTGNITRQEHEAAIRLAEGRGWNKAREAIAKRIASGVDVP